LLSYKDLINNAILCAENLKTPNKTAHGSGLTFKRSVEKAPLKVRDLLDRFWVHDGGVKGDCTGNSVGL